MFTLALQFYTMSFIQGTKVIFFVEFVRDFPYENL